MTTIKQIDGTEITINTNDISTFAHGLRNGTRCSIITMKDKTEIAFDPTANDKAQKEIEDMFRSFMGGLLK